MRKIFTVAVLIMLGSTMTVFMPSPSAAATAEAIHSQAEEALTKLYNQNELARTHGGRAKGILVFPEITKAGIGVGGSYGEGVLFVDGRPVQYYSVSSGSLGLTLGGQSFSQVIMFMTDEALQKFRASKGWEAGVDGSVVMLREGTAGYLDTTTSQEPILGYIFDQSGLMFDASFSGAKYTKVRR